MTKPLLQKQLQKKKAKALTSLEHIDDQIEALKAKKKRLEIKQAQELIKCLQKILDEAYSPDLVVGIVATAKDEISHPEKKEAWLAAANPFRQSDS